MKHYLLTFILLTIFACTPSEEERCEDDMDFQDGICVAITDSDDNGTDTNVDTAADNMGATCTKDSCHGPADYCLIGMGETEGYCTVEECTTDSCPSEFTCCVDFTFTSTSFCVKDAEFESIANYCGAK